jgi:tyrosine-protein kinase Etk/Wzc
MSDPQQLTEKQYRKLGDYWEIVLHRKWSVLAMAVVVFICGVLYSFSKDPVYSSSMTIQIQSEEMAMAGPSIGPAARFGREDKLQTKIAVIKSLPVAMRIVNKLKLNFVRTLIAGRPVWMKVADRVKSLFGVHVPLTHVDVSDFSVPDGQQFGTLLIRFLANGRFMLEEPVSGEKKEVGVHEPAVIGGFGLTITGFYGPEGTVYRVGTVAARPIAKSIQARMYAQKTGPDMLYVSFSDPDAKRPVAVLQTLAQVYAEEEIAFKGGKLGKKIKFLQEIQDRVQRDLNRIASAKGSDDLIGNAREEVVLKQIKGLGERWGEGESEVFRTRYALNYLKNVSSDKLEAAMAFLEVPASIQGQFAEVRAKIASLSFKRLELLKKVTSKFPSVIAIDNKLRHLRAKSRGFRKKVVESLELKIKFLQQRQERDVSYTVQLQKRFAEDPRKLQRIIERQSQNASLKSLLKRVVESKQKASIDRAIIVSDVRVIEPPQASSRPIRPNRMNDMLAALAAALAAGLGLGVLLENMDRSVKSITELEQKLGLAVFGSIPQVDTVGNGTSKLVTISSPRSAESEAYRSMRTNIQFANLEKTIQTVILTSATPGEGKTTTTGNLAVTLANSGLKTLLVDCDIRKPMVHNFFGLSRESGLSDILIHRANWREMVLSSGVENLDIVTAGSIPPNPSELLGSESMTRFLDQVKAEYQMVLLDVPPILVVTDAVLLGPKVDGLFLIVRANHAPMDLVQRALTQLNTVHLKPIGAIFNGFRIAHGYGYKKYGKYRKYGGYGYSKYGYYSHDYGEKGKSG